MFKVLLISPRLKPIKTHLNQLKISNQFQFMYASTVNEGIDLAIDFNLNLIAFDIDYFKDQLSQIVLDFNQSLIIPPKFIALSSTEHLAFKAFQLGFYAYFLQPFNALDFKKLALRLKHDSPDLIAETKLCLQSHKDFQYINTNEILFLKADSNTTDIYLKNDKIVTAYKTLKVFEENLPKNFTRIHRSYIINKNHISRINFGKQRCTLLGTVIKIPFSKSFKPAIHHINQQLSGFALSALN
ncbi:LytR/AlgR family response regulator transcription factor [Psychroflexus sp. ALD_RP9]|uniref:LytR/AlgR family response regulator transcription factor n=1 Tax=Psychroflexus sp. ALD_RP9 TaxID=2777186 RepID=UPI001A8D498D|nr:response regulator transcription factor [Psychroflexus sp. ALD_RP9]QSS98111.1 LytTR family transcriptional regulator DNA-binding domain-containing protein [Psychroflexus sp. ALD_RP9]